jgi:uncharacterized membrane protein
MPIPWLAANGLFPGLGTPGTDDAAGGALGASVIELGASLEVFFFGGSGASSVSGFSVAASGSFGSAVFLAAAFGFAAFFGSSFGLASGKAARSFLAIGGAIVEDPLLTYSPSSSNLARATLVSIPSSLATS